MKNHVKIAVAMFAIIVLTVFGTLFGLKVNVWHSKSVVLDCVLKAQTQDDYKACFK